MAKTIGVIGGMGPLATADFFNKIISLTPAKNDSEHIPVIVYNNTNIPDRTSAILGEGLSPTKELIHTAKTLKNMGADFLVMPCNTAHYYLKEIKENVDIPVIDMIEETVLIAKERGIRKIGLLATKGTIDSCVYTKMLEKHGVEYALPDEEGQKAITHVIYNGIKAGDYSIDVSSFQRAINRMTESGAEVMLLGCTELPLAFANWDFGVESVESSLVLAKKAVKLALEA